MVKEVYLISILRKSNERLCKCNVRKEKKYLVCVRVRKQRQMTVLGELKRKFLFFHVKEEDIGLLPLAFNDG